MRTLYLPLKKEWYEMIERGEKKEEYRLLKPYWEKRLLDYKKLVDYYEKHKKELVVKRLLFPHRPLIENPAAAFSRGYDAVRFSYGYTNRTMTFECKGIEIGTGRPEWGAPDEPVFIIKLGERIVDKTMTSNNVN